MLRDARSAEHLPDDRAKRLIEFTISRRSVLARTVRRTGSADLDLPATFARSAENPERKHRNTSPFQLIRTSETSVPKPSRTSKRDAPLPSSKYPQREPDRLEEAKLLPLLRIVGESVPDQQAYRRQPERYTVPHRISVPLSFATTARLRASSCFQNPCSVSTAQSLSSGLSVPSTLGVTTDELCNYSSEDKEERLHVPQTLQ